MKRFLNTPTINQTARTGTYLCPNKPQTVKSKPFWTLFALTLLTPTLSHGQLAQTVLTQSLEFELTDILVDSNIDLNLLQFKKELLDQHRNTTINLDTVNHFQQKLEQVLSQNKPQNSFDLTMILPQGPKGPLTIQIRGNTSTTTKPKNLKGTSYTIQEIQFSGAILAEPQSILEIANEYTGQSFSIIQALNLRKDLKQLHAENKLRVNISMPEYDPLTGNLFVHIEEFKPASTPQKQRTAITQKPKITEVKKLYEASKGIFLLNPTPKNWQEPKWLTQPPKIKKKKTKAITLQPETKSVKITTVKVAEPIHDATKALTIATPIITPNETSKTITTINSAAENKKFSQTRQVSQASKAVTSYGKRINIERHLTASANNGKPSGPEIYTRLNLNNKSDTLNTLNIQAKANILGMASHLNASVEDRDNTVDLDNVKATFTKLDSNGSMLGSFNAKQIEVGDITFQTQPLLNSNKTGRGVFVTNQELNAIRDPNNFQLSGNAPAGWDVEIYQNGFIVDFQTVNDDGRYNFTALPLQKGENTFDIEIYGPNGERKNFTETYTLDSRTLQKNEFKYDIIAATSTEDTFQLSNNSKGSLYNLSTEYGLLDNLTILGGIFQGETHTQDTTAITTGLRTSLLSTDIQTDFAYQDNGASAYQLELRRTLLNNLNTTFTYKKFDGYSTNANPVQAEYSTTFNKNFILKNSTPIYTQLKFTHEELRSSESQSKLSARISTKLQNLHISNEISATFNDQSDNLYSGTLALTKPFQGFNLRGQANYQFGDEGQKITQASLGLNGTLFNKLNLRTTLSQAYGTGIENTTWENLASWQTKHANIGLNLSGDSDGEVTAGLQFSTYYTPTRAEQNFRSSNHLGKSNTSAQILAFLDLNNNNKFDSADTPLQGAEFFTKQGEKTITNSYGIGVMTGLTPYVSNTITVNQLSIQQEHIKPYSKEITLSGKPFEEQKVNFPFKVTGQINGTVEYLNNEEIRPLSGAIVTLTNNTQTTVATTTSGIDGYFTFMGIPAGEYHIHTHHNTLTNKEGYEIEKPRNIEISIDQPIATNSDILIKDIQTSPTQLIDDALKNMQKETLPSTI